MASLASQTRYWFAVVGSGESVRARLARNTLWSISGAIAAQGSALAAAILLGRMLGLANFGQIAFIQATVMLLATIGEMGLALTVTKFVARWYALEPARAGRLIGAALRITACSGLVMTGVLILAARTGLGGTGVLRSAFPAACLLLVFDMLNRVQGSALSGLEAFDSVARLNVFRGALLLPCAGAGAACGGVPGALLGLGAVSAGTFLYGQRVLAATGRPHGIRIVLRGRFERGALETSCSLWGGALLQAGAAWAVTFLLSRPPAGMAQLGLFNAAEKWRAALLFLPNLLFQVTLPMLSHSHAARDHRACRRIVFASLGTTMAATGLSALAVAAFSRSLMASYGPGFDAGRNVLLIVACGSVASALYTVGSGVLWALGKPARMLAIDGFKTGLLVALCAAGMAASAWHAATAYLVSSGAGAAVLLWVLHRQLAKVQES